MLGYIFLGIAYGIVLQGAGYGTVWAFASSLFVFAGSAQFVMVNLLESGAALVTVFITILLVNSRHIFYGLTFIEKFRGLRGRNYLIFSLSDETYSLLCSMPQMDAESENTTMLMIAALDQGYWVIGSVIGGAFGVLLNEVLHLDLTGIDFSMTALFVVILLDQLKKREYRLPALIGGVSSFVALLILGSSSFLLPSLILTVTLLFVLRRPMERFASRGKGAEA